MATYKVIQDVEAEDTLIGPLTLKQCIYAGVAALSAYGCFVVIAKGMPYLTVILVPFLLFGAFFAFPWSKQQPTEIWALAKIRFMLKPRKRIWDQSGARELVTITAPKRVQRVLTKNLTQTEVKSRLKALADTIDTRGWAVKNVGVNVYQTGIANPEASDRLLSIGSGPQEVPNYDTTAVVDMLDAQTNPRAQELEDMMNASAAAHRQKLVNQLSQPQPVVQTPPVAPAPRIQAPAAPQMGPAPGINQMGPALNSSGASYWYLNHALPVDPSAVQTPQGISTSPQVPVAADPTAEEQAFAESLKQRTAGADTSYMHMRTIKPLAEQQAEEAAAQAAAAAAQASLPPVTPPINPATIQLANNDDLSVAAIAREAKRMNPDSPDEIVVSLR